MRGNGAVFINLSSQILAEWLLEIPSINTQQQIIDIIEPFEQMIIRYKRIIEIFKRILVLSYNFSSTKLCKFLDFVSVKSEKRSNENTYYATNAFGEWSIDYTKKQDITINKPSRANLSIANDSIIVSKIIGENKIFYFSKKPKFITSTGFFNFQTQHIDHVMGFLLSFHFKKQKEIFASGMIMTSMTNKALEKLKIKKPSIKNDSYAKIIFNLHEIVQSLLTTKDKIIGLLIK